MNFLLRSTNTPPHPSKKTLEGPVAEDPLFFEGDNGDSSRSGGDEASARSGRAVDARRSKLSFGGFHSDVSDEEGWIAIPCEKLPEDWSNATDIRSFRSFDRSFVFPGEQLHILACLATSKLDTEVISSSEVSVEMSMNNNLVEKSKQQIPNEGNYPSQTFGNVDGSIDQQETNIVNTIVNGELARNQENLSGEDDFSTSDGFCQSEGQNYQEPERLLERFKKSHFFVRIAESSETLWSKRSKVEPGDDGSRKTSRDIFLNANIDNRKFHGFASGGLVRDTARCYSLRNGDIVVLLQVNVGTDSLQNPVLEVLQFEKSRTSHVSKNNQASSATEDPNRELLRWLFPLDNAKSPLPLIPSLGSTPITGGGYHRPTLSASSPGSQLLSFSNFRSYSMSSLPQSTATPDLATPPPYLKHRSILEHIDQISSQKLIDNQDLEVEGHLSFRGVQLEPEQFIVQCGLEGIYLPGKRWKKSLKIVQPMEIQSYAADCNTYNLLCVQIKNVCPDHIPDIVIYLDTISIVFEESPNSGQPLSLPISCIETGSSHSLSNLALRKGEEHSFIVKPLILTERFSGGKSLDRSNFQAAPPGSSTSKMSKIRIAGASSHLNKYSVLVSYRCNYAESKLFLKKATNWRPHVAKDLMISVASEMSKEDSETGGRDPKFPVQVLTLQASNLTSEDLTLMVLAPSSSTATPAVVSLNSAPTTPVGPLTEISEFKERQTDRDEYDFLRRGSIPVPRNEQGSIVGASVLGENAAPSSDIFPNSDGATHLWLQSRVPIGRVPAQSSATVKLQLLPLTDGTITLDTLQVAVKEKGAIYTPESSLKIHVTSSIATGIS